MQIAMAIETPTPAHPLAMFGPAPYTFVGFQNEEDREADMAYRQRAGLPFTTNMCGGSCDLCGQAIMNVYTFESGSGFRFKLGFDCAKKAEVGSEAKEGRRRQRRERAEADYTRTRESALEAQRDRNEAAGHGRLTDDEVIAAIAAATKAIKEAQRAKSVHWGEVGKRVKRVELRHEGSYSFETAYGSKTIYFLRTLDGNATVWGTTAGLGRYDDEGYWQHVEKGASFFAAVSIKKHGEYKGEKQTEVTRLKVLAPEVVK